MYKLPGFFQDGALIARLVPKLDDGGAVIDRCFSSATEEDTT